MNHTNAQMQEKSNTGAPPKTSSTCHHCTRDHSLGVSCQLGTLFIF